MDTLKELNEARQYIKTLNTIIEAQKAHIQRLEIIIDTYKEVLRIQPAQDITTNN